MKTFLASPAEPLPHHPRTILVVAGALRREGRYLVGRRLPGGSAGGLWEFPGGKVERGEHPDEALRREFWEELALEVAVDDLVGRALSVTPERLLVLDLYLVRDVKPPARPRPTAHQEIHWLSPSEFERLCWAPPDQPLLDCLRLAEPQ